MDRNGTTAVVVDTCRDLAVYNVASGRLVHEIKLPETPGAMILSPDGHVIVDSYYEGQATLGTPQRSESGRA